MASPKQAARQQEERKRVSTRDWGEDRGYKSQHLKLPAGVEEFKLQVGTHEIDIMPYRAGAGHPAADVGYEVISRPYAAHRLEAGGRKSLFCCRWACWKLPCPVCTFRNSRDCAPELAKELYAADRDLYLINDNPGKKVKWKVFDQTFKNRGVGFGEMLRDELSKLRTDFAFDLESGHTLILTVKEQITPNFKFNAVTRIDVRPRDYSYPPELLDKAPCLDEMLVDPGEQELLDILGSGGSRTSRSSTVVGNGRPREEDDEDEDMAPRTKVVRRTVEDPEPDDDEDEPRPQSRRRAADPDDDEDDEDGAEEGGDDEDLVPAAKAKKGSTKSEPTADEYDLEEGMKVEYEGDVYTIKKVSGDGTSLTLVDADGERVNGVAPDEVQPAKAKKAPPKRAEPEDEDDEPAPKSKGRKAPVEDDDEDEPTPPKKGKAQAEEDDEAEFSDGWDDDEDEPAPSPKKAKKR